TKLSNLVLICSSHHRLIHEGRLRVEGADRDSARFVFLDELGRELPRVPALGGTGEPFQIGIDPKISEPRWDGSRMRLGECVSAMLASPAFSPG
ncbi:MAG: hypothetical protein KC431_08790, partial [Myxococcales bacterium]|nr:hypothetical protein [Myxococcales bacterium]